MTDQRDVWNTAHKLPHNRTRDYLEWVFKAFWGFGSFNHLMSDSNADNVSI